MKNQKEIVNRTINAFNGRVYPKLKRIRIEPRQRIRQLLRSFVPPETFQDQQKNDRELYPN